MEAALLENEVVDVMADELEGLGEEGGEGGGRRDRAISEVQSCSELQYSKGRVISAVQWLPGRKVSTLSIPLWLMLAELSLGDCHHRLI